MARPSSAILPGMSHPAGTTLLVCAALAVAPHAAGGELRLEAALVGRLGSVESGRSWLDGGFSRLGESGGSGGDARTFGRGQAHVGLDWRPSEVVRVFAHGVARAQPPGVATADAGLVEAFVSWAPQPSPGLTLRFKGGLFFPQTSRENVDPLWQSRYTLTLSALNTWIGEEVRLLGVESGAVFRAEGGSALELAGALFGGNDTAGTLLAWRGWALGDHLVGPGDRLPLPPLRTLGDGGPFAAQRDDGTRPVDELDGRPGVFARARWDRPGAVLLQASWYDNRGDRALHRGQYAWRTRWAQAGLELRRGGLRLIAEGARGQTGMGERSGPHVDVDFEAVYALASWGTERVRLSARYDAFEIEDRDGTAEPGDERGHAWTFAALWRPWTRLRLGIEWSEVVGERPAAADSGFDPAAGGRRGSVELRLLF